MGRGKSWHRVLIPFVTIAFLLSFYIMGLRQAEAIKTWVTQKTEDANNYDQTVVYDVLSNGYWRYGSTIWCSTVGYEYTPEVEFESAKKYNERSMIRLDVSGAGVTNPDDIISAKLKGCYYSTALLSTSELVITRLDTEIQRDDSNLTIEQMYNLIGNSPEIMRLTDVQVKEAFNSSYYGTTGTGIDITQVVKDWISNAQNSSNGYPNYGLGLMVTPQHVDNVNDHIDLYSLNHTDNQSYRPYIELVINVPAPVAPSDFTATQTSYNQITWSWTDNSNSEDGFRIYDQNGAIVKTVGANVKSYSETVETGASYTRYVVAYSDAGGESTVSNTVSQYANYIRIEGGTVGEAGSQLGISVTRGGDLTKTSTVDYSTADSGSGNGFATGGTDYNATSGSFTFYPGETSKTITIPITSDNLYEGNETFNVGIANATEPFYNDTDRATCTITDDDLQPQVQLSATTFAVAEGSSFDITVNRTGATENQVSVYLQPVFDTATSSDYSAGNVLIQFLAGDTTKSATISIDQDTLYEGEEVFSLQLSGVTGGAIGIPSAASITISDDDLEPKVQFAATSYSISEGSSKAITINRTGATGAEASVYIKTIYNTADSSDFSGLDTLLSFAAGETSKSITIDTNEDSTYESNEDFRLELYNPQNCTLDTTSITTISIVNDDSKPVEQLGLATNLDNCTDCHGSMDFGVGNVDRNGVCYYCHSVFGGSHIDFKTSDSINAGFADIHLNHHKGSTTAPSAYTGSCDVCHYSIHSFGNLVAGTPPIRKVNCKTCHPNVAHENHGNQSSVGYYVDAGQMVSSEPNVVYREVNLTCTSSKCHSTYHSPTGIVAKPSCEGCHPNPPHGSYKTSDDEFGVTVEANTNPSYSDIEVKWQYQLGDTLKKSLDGITWTPIDIGSPTPGNNYVYTDIGVQNWTIVYYKRIRSDGSETWFPVYPPGDNAHMNYLDNTSLCALCHVTHGAQQAKLLKEETIEDLCRSCHGLANTGSRYNVDTGEIVVAGNIDENGLITAISYVPSNSGAFGIESGGNLYAGNHANTWNGAQVTSVHNVQTNSIAPGGVPNALKLTCTSCHKSHPKKNSYRLLKIGTVEAYAVNPTGSEERVNYIKNMNVGCGCHGDYIVPAASGSVTTDSYYRHSVGVPIQGPYASINPKTQSTWSLATNLPTEYQFNNNGEFTTVGTLTGSAPVQYIENGAIFCLTCHYAHGTVVTGGNRSSYDLDGNSVLDDESTMLKRQNNMDVCEDCHKK